MALVAAGGPAWALDLQGQTQATPDQGHVEPAAKVTQEGNPDDKAAMKQDSERVADSYQPKGIDLGQFLLLPKVDIDETFNSNVYAAPTDQKSDFITTISPQLNLKSRFSEHELDLSMAANQYLYSTYSTDSRLDLQGNVNGRYDFSTDTQASIFGQASSGHEDRGSPDDAHGITPTPVDGYVSLANVKHQFGHYTVLGEVEADRWTYGDVRTSLGTLVPNSDRNRWELTARERGSYEMFPGYAAVLQISENSHIFDQTYDRSGFDRSSNGLRAEGGVGVDVSQLIRGEFLVGYLQQNYDDSRFKDPGGVSVHSAFNWTPTKLTIVIPSLDRTVYDTTTALASALVRDAAAITVRHELARNIILTGFGTVYYDEETGVSNQDSWSYETRGRVIYAFNSELYVGSEIDYQNRHSQNPLNSFDQLKTMVRLGVQY